MDSGPVRRRDQSDMETRISQFLGEFRIMVPGLAALLGFQLTSAWSSGWERSPFENKVLNFAAILCIMLALILVLVPALYHRSMREIEENDRFLRFAARYFGAGVAFFAVGLVITVYLQGYRVFGARSPSLAVAVVMAGVLVWLWIAVPQRRVKRVLRDGGDDPGARQPGPPVTSRPQEEGAAGRQL